MTWFRLPPSSPTRTWYRALVPLVPRPAVLPFEPSPRPTRVLAFFAPGAGARLCSLSVMSVDLLDRHQVTDGVDHAADLRAVLLDDHVADPLEAQRAKRVALVLLQADEALVLANLELCHQADTSAGAAAAAVPSSRALSRAAGATSSTRRPRRAATDSG